MRPVGVSRNRQRALLSAQRIVAPPNPPRENVDFAERTSLHRPCPEHWFGQLAHAMAAQLTKTMLKMALRIPNRNEKKLRNNRRPMRGICLIVFATIAITALASCPNQCSGHGRCNPVRAPLLQKPLAFVRMRPFHSTDTWYARERVPQQL